MEPAAVTVGWCSGGETESAKRRRKLSRGLRFGACRNGVFYKIFIYIYTYTFVVSIICVSLGSVVSGSFLSSSPQF